jgi:hypothetical protein
VQDDGGHVTRLDPDDLRVYARRDWGAPERLARVDRVRQPVEAKVRIAVDLYEASKALRPGWPDDTTRRADLEHHLQVRAMLDKAVHVGLS